MSYAVAEISASSTGAFLGAPATGESVLLMPVLRIADASSGTSGAGRSLVKSILRKVWDQASSPEVVRHKCWNLVGTGAATNQETAAAAQDDVYMRLYDAVASMARLPEGQDYAIDAKTAKAAERFIALMSLYNVPAPKVFSHGGDAVVFTWELGAVRRYVTVGDGEVSILDTHRGSNMHCSAEFPLNGDVPVESWMVLLGGQRWRSAAAT